MSMDEIELKQMEEVDLDDMPDADEVGPAVLGKTPLLGEFRRKQDLPVLRDEIGDEIDLSEELDL